MGYGTGKTYVTTETNRSRELGLVFIAKKIIEFERGKINEIELPFPLNGIQSEFIDAVGYIPKWNGKREREYRVELTKKPSLTSNHQQ